MSFASNMNDYEKFECLVDYAGMAELLMNKSFYSSCYDVLALCFRVVVGLYRLFLLVYGNYPIV